MVNDVHVTAFHKTMNIEQKKLTLIAHELNEDSDSYREEVDWCFCFGQFFRNIIFVT